MRGTGRFLLLVGIVVTFVVAMASLDGGGGDARLTSGPQVDSSQTLESISLEGSADDELTDPATTAARYVIVRDDTATGPPDLAAIRAANPGAQVLVYKNAAFTLWDPESEGTDPATGEPRCPYAPFQGGGVDYCAADPNESWFLHSAADPTVRLTSAGYAGQWAMNPAEPGYRDAWEVAVLARLQDANRNGLLNEGPDDRYDGVYLDDVNVRPGHGLAETGIAEAPAVEGSVEDVPAYRDGIVGFVDQIAGAVRDQGFLVMANVDANIEDQTQRDAALDIAADLDVYNQERFMRLYFERPKSGEAIDVLSTDPPRRGTIAWSSVLGFMGAVQDTGAGFSGIAYGRDGGTGNELAQRYIRASFLLGWNGADGSALAYRSLDDTDGGPLGLPEWTASIGELAGETVPVGAAFERRFSGGLAAVNPTLDSDAEIPLAGAYRVPDGSCPDSVTLGPVDALILPRCDGNTLPP